MKPELHKDHRRRMRERFKKNGSYSFEDHEMLEMFLYYVIPRRNTNDIAHELLLKFGTLDGVISANEESLCEISGIGETAAQKIRYFSEFYDRVSREVYRNILIDSDDKAGMYAMLRMGLAPADSALVAYLDGDGAVISEEHLYRGNTSLTEDLPHYITSGAKDAGAVGILLMHNHKNEPLRPSSDDTIITEKLRSEALSCGISRVLHVITSEEGYIFI